METNRVCFRLLFAVVLLVKVSQGTPVDNVIKTLCHRTDPKLDECILKTAYEIRPKLKAGIKQLKIQPLEPFIITKLHLQQGTGSVSLDISYNDINMHGLSEYEIKKLHFDLDKREMNIEGYYKEIRTHGKYETNGKILALPIVGKGDYHSRYSDVSCTLNIKFKPETKNGKEYWTLAEDKFDLDIKQGTIHFDNLFNGNKQLGDTTNAFIAENWTYIFQELKPVIKDTVKAFMLDLISKLFKAYSIDELFPQ